MAFKATKSRATNVNIMGLFVRIDFVCCCPRCGRHVDGFQSKEFQDFTLYKPWEVDAFCSQCFHCKLWLDIVRLDKDAPLPERVPPPEPKNWENKYELRFGDNLGLLRSMYGHKGIYEKTKTVDARKAKS